jgi:hypothetical protein
MDDTNLDLDTWDQNLPESPCDEFKPDTKHKPLPNFVVRRKENIIVQNVNNNNSLLTTQNINLSNNSGNNVVIEDNPMEDTIEDTMEDNIEEDTVEDNPEENNIEDLENGIDDDNYTNWKNEGVKHIKHVQNDIYHCVYGMVMHVLRQRRNTILSFTDNHIQKEFNSLNEVTNIKPIDFEYGHIILITPDKQRKYKFNVPKLENIMGKVEQNIERTGQICQILRETRHNDDNITKYIYMVTHSSVSYRSRSRRGYPPVERNYICPLSNVRAPSGTLLHQTQKTIYSTYPSTIFGIGRPKTFNSQWKTKIYDHGHQLKYVYTRITKETAREYKTEIVTKYISK